MRKITFLIDGCEYIALMGTDEEIIRFIWDNEADGSTIEIAEEIEISVDEILADSNFEYPYKIEIIAIMLLPNANTFKKWYQQEAELKRLGLI